MFEDLHAPLVLLREDLDRAKDPSAPPRVAWFDPRWELADGLMVALGLACDPAHGGSVDAAIDAARRSLASARRQVTACWR